MNSYGGAAKNDRSVLSLKRKAEKAWQRRRLYDRTLREIYDYVMPMRDVSGLQTSGGRSEGRSRVDKVFDATAMKAAFRFAGRLQSELTPLFQPFFSLEPGPLLSLRLSDDELSMLRANLQRITKVVSGVLSSGSFHQSSHEMYLDLFAGTAAMLVMPGDDLEPVRFTVVPIAEIAIEEGPYGDIWGVYWKRKWPAKDLEILWPEGRFSDKLKRLMSQDGDDEVEICQYSYFDPDDKVWRLVVWADKNADHDAPIWEEATRTKRWITPRFFKVPGEPYGSGPAQLALPFVKTANMTRELALKAAAFAIMGIWMRRNDGVFNPDAVQFKPLAMWDVASTGGPLGPSIQRLPVPDNFDVSSIVMADEREQMKQALFDDTLPPETGAVRSATEIAERMRRLSQDLSGVFGRLTLEIVKPLVQAVLDILAERGAFGEDVNITIDQLITEVRVVSPIAAGQQAAKVETAVNWVQMMGMLGGQEAAFLAAKVEDLFPELGRWLGVEERFIRSQREREELQRMAGEAMAMQQMGVGPAGEEMLQ